MEINPTDCLNCGQTLRSNFCSHCGQKVTTKRFTTRQLLSKDFLSGFFDLEKGFLFTLKSLFTRPGHFVREYVEGKRKTYFHFLSFLLIILGISIFIGEFSTFKFTDITSNTSSISDKMGKLFEDFTKSNPKTIILLQIPIYAILSYLFFIKVKMNFAEHIVLNSYKASGELVIGILFTLLTFFNISKTTLTFILALPMTILVMVFMVILYYQFFNKYYKNKVMLTFRIIIASLIAQLAVGTLIWIIVFLKFAMEGGDLKTILPS